MRTSIVPDYANIFMDKVKRNFLLYDHPKLGLKHPQLASCLKDTHREITPSNKTDNKSKTS